MAIEAEEQEEEPVLWKAPSGIQEEADEIPGVECVITRFWCLREEEENRLETSEIEKNGKRQKSGSKARVSGMRNDSDEDVAHTPQKSISSYCVHNVFVTSSFIQDILYEDSRAGIAVVDLFVCVKTVKDNLDFLAKCNNEVFNKINDLNRETKQFKEQYSAFLRNVEMFLTKINADSKSWEILSQKTNPSVQEVSEELDRKKSESQKTEVKESLCENCGGSSQTCSECGKVDGSKGKKPCTGCFGCFLSTFKERSLSRLPVLSEALLGSFLASLFWLQNVRESSVPSTRSSSPSSPSLFEEKEKKRKKRNESLSVRDSTIRMMNDVCGGVTGDSKEFKQSSLKTEDSEMSSEPSFASMFSDAGSNTEKTHDKCIIKAPANEFSCLYRGQNPKKTLKISKSEESIEETISGEETDYEEALSEPLVVSKHYDLKAKPSLTCMGDVRKAVTEKKSTKPAINVPMSWVDKLSEEIISKLMIRKSKGSVRICEHPYEKEVKKLSNCLEFTMEANTPLGVFDVMVVKHKNSRLLNDRLLNQSTNLLHTVCAPLNNQLTDEIRIPREHSCCWSEESLPYVDSDSISNSGDSDLEEFIEIFLENPSKKNSRLTLTLQNKGRVKEMTLKEWKPNMFEIQKYYPNNFVQEICRKTTTTTEKDKCGEERNKEKFSMNSGEKKQKQIRIPTSSSDLVIYIQLEVDGNSSTNTEEVVLEYRKSSHGTQTTGNNKPEAKFSLSRGRTIRLDENKFEGESLYQVWRGRDKSPGLCSNDEQIYCWEEKSSWGDIPENKEGLIVVKEPKEKTVTFNEELSEIFIETEIQETNPEYDTIEVEAVGVDLKDIKQHADVWLVQRNLQQVQRVEIRSPRWPLILRDSLELEKALKLIREIESDVVDVKLSDAMSILPRLESELRKHLQGKIKNLGEKECETVNSVESFISANDFWQVEPTESSHDSETSEERLNNLLGMLSELEKAVKSSEHSCSNVDLCQCDSSKIYKLLQALTMSIREVEGRPSVTNLSQTLEIASELDTAVREYESMTRSQPLDCVLSERDGLRDWMIESRSEEEVVTVMQHMKNVRKKVFQIVEEEAIDVEGRLEKDFDRLDRLEGENDEALMFLEAFLQKTERRVTELAKIKVDLKDLSSLLNDMYEILKENMRRKPEVEVVQIKGPEDGGLLTDSSVDSISVKGRRQIEIPVKETVSGLLIALDTLKSRAKEKNELCKEILSSDLSEKESEISSRRSSRSSFTTKHAQDLYSKVKEFKKIGNASMYMSWSKPEGLLKDSIVGYHIHVNEKLNQKVRNPERLQAVLYSVDLTDKVDVQLYAFTEKGPRILLATVTYQDK